MEKGYIYFSTNGAGKIGHPHAKTLTVGIVHALQKLINSK